jgi:beta-galactosidase
MRRIMHLNRGWEFTERIDEGFIAGAACPAAVVALPHTVKQTPLNYFDESEYQMVSGYRRRLRLPEGCGGKNAFLTIGAAAHYAEVYLDGALIAAHKGGYTAFRVDLTGRLSEDRDSLLCIKVDSRESLNIPPFGYMIDYMTYGGLYREVRLDICESSYIDDVFAVPTVPGEITTEGMTPEGIAALTFDGRINCLLKIENIGALTVRQRVYPHGSAADREPLAEKTFVKGDICEITVPGAKLWDVESPALYTLVTELLDGDTVLDRVDTTVGFRRSEFKADGYYLNGRYLKIRGLNRHQSYPYVGYAMPRSIQRYDADILKKELGLNAVRTSHYPQSPHFIDRCDELGLLVFTEIPGWQHIGDDEWKDTAVLTCGEMIRQYRSHPSIILWGVRINESQDDDAFYTRTNALAHELDPTRPTGGVRYIKKSHLLEDVYTYNDFSHEGTAPGCTPKASVTSDFRKPYLISEYNGHMYPTKSHDDEEHRAEHALRHARVLNAVAEHKDICGSFGWCFFDYNTHRDFGAGDRICYHGVCDMFRNPKLAAAVYASQQEDAPVLELSSSMDIGEHPASVRGPIYAFTNADSLRFYKDGVFITEYEAESDEFGSLIHPPIQINDFVGDRILEGESFGKKQAAYVKDILNEAAIRGMNNLTPAAKAKAAYLTVRRGMSYEDAYNLYGKYIANWGSSSSVFRFEAVKNGEIVRVVEKSPFTERHMTVSVSHTDLVEGETYDAAAIRIRLTDQNGNTLSCFNSTVRVTAEGAITLIGPGDAPILGGMGGLYVRTIGETGEGTLTIEGERLEKQIIRFTVRSQS